MIDDSEDCNDGCKVFLGVNMGVNRHVEVGIVRKLDLHDNVYLRYIWDGWLVAQLPFLALSIIQPAGSLEGGTHFGVLPDSRTMQEFLERRLQRNS